MRAQLRGSPSGLPKLGLGGGGRQGVPPPGSCPAMAMALAPVLLAVCPATCPSVCLGPADPGGMSTPASQSNALTSEMGTLRQDQARSLSTAWNECP